MANCCAHGHADLQAERLPPRRLAAVTIGRSDTALGAFYRRLSAGIGKQKSVTATARKIAVLFYNAIRHDMIYQDQGVAANDKRHRQRVLSNLQRLAKTLGYARWSLRLLEKRVVELGIVEAASDSTPGRVLKKINSNRTKAAIG